MESSAIPLLASPQGGVSASSTNFAKPPKLTQTGWFSFCSYRKTTPSSRSADASRYFLDRSATPPCGDARRGVTLDCNLFTGSIDRAYRGKDLNRSFRLIRTALVYDRPRCSSCKIVGGHRPPLQLGCFAFSYLLGCRDLDCGASLGRKSHKTPSGGCSSWLLQG